MRLWRRAPAQEPSAGDGVALPLRWHAVMKIWWAISWRTLVGMVAGAGAGMVASLLLYGTPGFNANAEDAALYGWMLSTAPAGMWGVRAALRRRYADFRLRLWRDA